MSMRTRHRPRRTPEKPESKPYVFPAAPYPAAGNSFSSQPVRRAAGRLPCPPRHNLRRGEALPPPRSPGSLRAFPFHPPQTGKPDTAPAQKPVTSPKNNSDRKTAPVPCRRNGRGSVLSDFREPPGSAHTAPRPEQTLTITTDSEVKRDPASKAKIASGDHRRGHQVSRIGTKAAL